MIDAIFLIGLVLMGVWGVYRYYSAEDNAYVLLNDEVTKVRQECQEVETSVTEAFARILEFEKRIKSLEEQITSTKKVVDEVKKESKDDIENAQEHLALLRKDVQRIDAKPQRLELLLDPPTKPIPVDVQSKNVGLRTMVTKKKVRKNKDGSWTIFQKSLARPYRKSDSKPSKELPGAEKAKQAMSEAML